MFIDELYNSGIIDQRIFSFYISKGEANSRITIGGYNLQKYASASVNQSITWNDLINTHYWSVGMVGVKLGTKTIPVSTNVAIVDTGTSYLLMPS